MVVNKATRQAQLLKQYERLVAASHHTSSTTSIKRITLQKALQQQQELCEH